MADKVEKFVKMIKPGRCPNCDSMPDTGYQVQFYERISAGDTISLPNPTTVGGLSKLGAEMLYANAILNGASPIEHAPGVW